jgi:deoxyadenosine/deoxycytidine kinase
MSDIDPILKYDDPEATTLYGNIGAGKTYTLNEDFSDTSKYIQVHEDILVLTPYLDDFYSIDETSGIYSHAN